MSHFCVRMDSDLMDQTAGMDNLRIYYSDTFSTAPAPPLIKQNERTVDVEALCEWIQNVKPRTRLDAYPLWILTKDMLRRFVSQDVHILSQQQRLLSEKCEEIQTQKRVAERRARGLDVELKACMEKLKRLEELEQLFEEQRKELVAAEQKARSLENKVESMKVKMEDQVRERPVDLSFRARKGLESMQAYCH